MLQTLIKLGQQGGESRGVWDDILKFPKPDEDKKGPLHNYCLPVRFDLDNSNVTFGPVREFHSASSRDLFNLAVITGNVPSIYVCVDGRKHLKQFSKTFFGKSVSSKRGDMLIELSKNKILLKTPLANTLERIFLLRSKFEQLILDDDQQPSLKKVSKQKNLSNIERIILVYAEIKCSDLGLNEFTQIGGMHDGKLAGVSGYSDFIKSRYKDLESTTSTEATDSSSRICYATGMLQNNVILPNSPRTGESLSRMFVTTTLHYAPTFEKSAYNTQYQVNTETHLLIERGSKKLLQKYTTHIAGVKHCLIPRLLSNDKSQVENYLPHLKRSSDLLFQISKIDDAEIEIQLDSEIYWITFLGFVSDGKSFKTINLIEDVSQTYFSQLIIACQFLNSTWRQAPEMLWNEVMPFHKFNLYTIYGLIPVRKYKKKEDSEHPNAALLLFKQILERRPVRRAALFAHFREVILCHRYRRYGAYGNIYDNNQNGKLSTAQAFDYAARATVYQYLALFQLLTQFNLFADMEPTTPELDAAPAQLELESEATPPKPLSEYQQKIENFFVRTGYSDAQKALFYLGRALNVVAYEQYKKGYESKPVLAKLNYAGMDGRALMRLRNDLADKARQFNLHGLMEPLLGRFHGLFGSLEQWAMHPEEALFYVLSGYTFYTK